MQDAKFQQFRLADLNPAEYNPRTISDDGLRGLSESLKRFGCVEPIIVNIRDGRNAIVGGHQRTKALSELHGADYETTCVVVDLSEPEERMLNIALNNPEIQGEFDMDKLQESIEFIQREMPDDTGILDMQIGKLIGDIQADIGSVLEQEAKASLAEKFIIPPFSVLDSRQGYWQERKQSWINLGIRSELGGRDKLKTSGSLSGSVPHYYEYKRLAENKLGRELCNSEFEKEYLADYMPANSSLAFTESGGILSVFDPVLCEIAYRWFCPPAGRVLDPFAGGSVRGVIANYLGCEYVGVELRPEQVEANREQAKALLTAENQPVWITGDSTELDKLVESEFDLVFSCPPYADLEVYSDDPQDLSNMDYSDFLKSYRLIIEKSVAKLKNNRFACFVVGDVRDKKTGFYRDFVSDTIAAFIDAGMELYNEAILLTSIGSLPVRVGKQFQSGRKLGKAHQNVLVFFKGDPKTIKDDFGPVEVGEISE